MRSLASHSCLVPMSYFVILRVILYCQGKPSLDYTYLLNYIDAMHGY